MGKVALLVVTGVLLVTTATLGSASAAVPAKNAGIAASLASHSPRARASSYVWFNTAYHVAEILYYRFTSPDGVGFGYVRCRGLFNHPATYRNGRWWFHRLSCSAEDYEARWFGIAVTVTGPYSVYARETWCSDAKLGLLLPRRIRSRLAQGEVRASQPL
jgi:hypothetical protein